MQTDFALLQELLRADEDPECKGLTQDELIERTGRSRSHISERISILQDSDLVERFRVWNQSKWSFRLTDANRFDPYTDSPIPLELLD